MLIAPNPKSTVKKLQDQATMMPFGQGILADLEIKKRQKMAERGLVDGSTAAEEFKTGLAKKYGRTKESLFG